MTFERKASRHFRLQACQKFVQRSDLAGKLLQGSLLGSGEKLDSSDAKTGMFFSSGNDLFDIRSVDAELASVCQPKQKREIFLIFF